MVSDEPRSLSQNSGLANPMIIIKAENARVPLKALPREEAPLTKGLKKHGLMPGFFMPTRFGSPQPWLEEGIMAFLRMDGINCPKTS